MNRLPPHDARLSPTLPVWVTPSGGMYIIRSGKCRRRKPHYAGGYAKTEFVVDGKRRQQFVHLLVAELFLPPKPSPEYVCRHIGARRDNSVTNLKWDTHGAALKPPRGEQHYFAKLTEPQVLEILDLLATGSFMKKTIAARFNVSPETVSAIWAGRCWAHLPRPWRMAA